MYYELNWLGAVLLGLGILVLAGPISWLIVRALRHRAELREHRTEQRPDALRRRLVPNDEQP